MVPKANPNRHQPVLDTGTRSAYKSLPTVVALAEGTLFDNTSANLAHIQR